MKNYKVIGKYEVLLFEKCKNMTKNTHVVPVGTKIGRNVSNLHKYKSVENVKHGG